MKELVVSWEAGHLSTREAAAKLGLTYYDFVDLLHARDIPVVREMSDDSVLEQVLSRLKEA